MAGDAGALRELCQDGRNGVLCPEGDVDAMAAGLRKILLDDSLRERMSQESLAIAKTHDIEHTLDQFEALYKEVMA